MPREMGPFYDNKPSTTPFLLQNAGQTYSDAPQQRLWRPDSSTPEGSVNERRERHRSKHFSLRQRVRNIFFVGALTIGFGLLVLWLFLLLTDTPNKVQNSTPTLYTMPSSPRNNVTIAPRKGNEGQRLNKDKARTAQKQQQRHHHIIHVTAPSTTTESSKESDKGMGTTPTMASPEAIYVDKMEMPKWTDGQDRTQFVVAQIERIGGTGTAKERQTTTMLIATSSTPTSKTTWTTTPTATSFVETTVAKLASTTERIINSKWTKSETNVDEDDDDDLFWMRGYSNSGKQFHSRPTDSFRVMPSSNIHVDQFLTSARHSSAEKAEPNGYNAKRPIIQFEPMDAMEVAGKARDREYERQEQVKQELNEVIASVESDNFSPVEIPFDPVEPPSVPVVEPVWRRPPPDETALPIPSPPRKPTSSKMAPQVGSHKINAEQPMHGKIKLDRKRREAPVMVTALLDIGRGDWQRFTRHFDQYLGYLANIVLRLQNRLIIYCDPSVTSYLLSLGNRIDWERIQVVEMSLRELPYYKYRDEIEEIMSWDQKHWHSDWDEQMRSHPETIYPDYDILVNSKPYFLLNATIISRFPKPLKSNQQFFVWLDAGYGHGSISEIPHGVWSPVLKAGKITLVQLTPKMDRAERYTLDKVYRKHKSVVSGGFLAGSPDAIKRFYTFFHMSFLEMLDQKMVDDDQTTLLVTIQKIRSTFNIIFGGWFDAFKLLASQ